MPTGLGQYEIRKVYLHLFIYVFCILFVVPSFFVTGTLALVTGVGNLTTWIWHNPS